MSRIEKDFIGDIEIPDDALYGIHSFRAKLNFENPSIFNINWYKAIGVTKKAVYHVYRRYTHALEQKYPNQKWPTKLIENDIIDALINAAEEIAQGKYFNHFIVPAIQGGAGTSINLNVNEIIANRALLLSGQKIGDYDLIDPIEHANVFQSTNDVIPTALKLACMGLLNELEESINKLRFGIESYEKRYRNSLRIAYTQMQEAVPSSYGNLFSSYNDALSRDWWRVSKCFERIKVVNIGGSAIGTSITVPRFYVMEIVRELQALTKLPITRGENLVDTTANLDSFVEVHATLKSHAVNLEKMVNDIRILSSDIFNEKGIQIPQKQVGSSIMPSKVNPVIPEYVIGAAHKIYSNDNLITNLAAQGCLELNAYIPIIGNAILESLELLISCNKSLEKNLFKEMLINENASIDRLMNSPVVTTALVPFVGYNKAAELSREMKAKKCDVFKANNILKVIKEEKLKQILKPSNLLKAGYTINDLLDS